MQQPGEGHGGGSGMGTGEQTTRSTHPVERKQAFEVAGVGAPVRDGRPSAPAGPARTAICVRDLALRHEVLDFLDRDPRVEIVSASDVLPEVFDGAPALDAAVLCADSAAALRGTRLRGDRFEVLVVAEDLTVPVLRAAIGAAAAAVYAWPEERAELAEAVGRSRGTRRSVAPPRGRVIAVFGGRGGVGTTFVATHLAAALADRGARAALVDMDVSFSQVTAALGFAPDQAAHTVADLLDVAEELSPDHVERALTMHPRGFSVLLAPDVDAAGVATEDAGDVEDPRVAEAARYAGIYAGSIALLAGEFDVVVVHVPRTLDRLSRAAVRLADRVVVVSTLDLLSLYGTRRALHALRLEADEQRNRCLLVLNRAQRGARARDAERVLGLHPSATLPADAAVGRFQDRGELMPRGSRGASRAIGRLAELLGASQEPASERRRGRGGRRR